jgi:hypothetical protein
MAEARVERLAAILAADVAGYSRPMGANEEAPSQRLARPGLLSCDFSLYVPRTTS